MGKTKIIELEKAKKLEEKILLGKREISICLLTGTLRGLFKKTGLVLNDTSRQKVIKIARELGSNYVIQHPVGTYGFYIGGAIGGFLHADITFDFYKR